MSEMELAPSAGATEVDAAVAPAPGAETADTSGLSKQGWLAEFNKAVSEGTKDEEPPAAEAPAEPESEPIAAAPVAPPTAGAEASPEEQLAKFRDGLKKSNLDSELKKVVNDAYVRDRAFREAGFTVKDAKTLHQIGFTPDRAMRLQEQFPTDEIADVTVGQAHAFQSIMNDFSSDPQRFLLGLADTNQDAAQALIDLVVDNITDVRPQKYRAMYDTFAQRLVSELEKDAAVTEDEDYKEAVGIITKRLFPNRGAQRAPGPPDPRLSAAEQELARYKQREDQARQQQMQQQGQFRQQFAADVQTTAARAVTQAIEQIIPANVPAEAKAELVEAIFGDVYRAATADRTVMSQLNALLQRAPLTQEGFNQAVGFGLKVAKGYIGPKAVQRLSKWTNGVITQQEARATVAATAAAASKLPPKVTTAAKPAPAVPTTPQGKAPRTRNEWLAALNSLT